MFNSYCHPIDIAERLGRAKRFWVHGEPTICLCGTQGEFGELSFDFEDEVVKWKIFLKDKDKILNAAEIGVLNYGKLLAESEAIWD